MKNSLLSLDMLVATTPKNSRSRRELAKLKQTVVDSILVMDAIASAGRMAAQKRALKDIEKSIRQDQRRWGPR
jgi:hypothetical protein